MVQRVTGPGSLVIGESSTEQKFDADVTKAALTPKADGGDIDNFLDGSSEAAAQTVTWTLDCTVKDNFSKDSPQVWCFQHQGETLPFKFVPNDTAEIGFSGKVLVTPLGFGGDVKKKNDQDMSFSATDVILTDAKGAPLTTTPPAEG
jgi:hypothetical protein